MNDFYQKMVTKKEKQYLLELARDAIINRSNKNKKLNIENSPELLKEKKGVFVSVYVNNELRGCIGHLLPNNTIYQSVIENAVRAAYYDYRFISINKKELNNLKIEISLLTDPVRLNFINASHLLKKLDNEEGLILKKGKQMAIFLPQVWEKIPDKEEFLAHLSMKAGLNPDAWKESDAEVYAYRVEGVEG